MTDCIKSHTDIMKPIYKLSSIAFFSVLTLLFSCKKEANGPGTGTGGAVGNGNGIVDPKLLTEKTWFYYEYFENYSQATASLVYKFERSKNTLDLSKNRITFKKDSTFLETKDGQVYRAGKWKVTSPAEIEVVDADGSSIFTIITLTEGFWVFTNPKLDIYGTMLAM